VRSSRRCRAGGTCLLHLRFPLLFFFNFFYVIKCVLYTFSTLYFFACLLLTSTSPYPLRIFRHNDTLSLTPSRLLTPFFRTLSLSLSLALYSPFQVPTWEL